MLNPKISCLSLLYMMTRKIKVVLVVNFFPIFEMNIFFALLLLYY